MFETIHHFQQLSSCTGSSCGVYFNTAPNDGGGLYFGATHLQGGYIPGGTSEVPQTEHLGANSWLSDSNSTVDYNMATSDQVAHSNLAAFMTSVHSFQHAVSVVLSESLY